MLGAEMSCTLIVWLTVCDEMPHVSCATAFHVIVRLYVPVQDPGVVTSLTTTICAEQLLVTVGVANAGAVPHWIVEGAGSELIVGVQQSLLQFVSFVLVPEQPPAHVDARR